MEPTGNELEGARWLDDRRVMETRQEIDKIEQLGKVSVKSIIYIDTIQYWKGDSIRGCCGASSMPML